MTPVERIVVIMALMNEPSCWLRRVPQRSATTGGRSSALTIAAETASSKSWQLYAIRSAQLTTSPSGVLGAGRDQEGLRIPSSVSRQRLRLTSETSAPHVA